MSQFQRIYENGLYLITEITEAGDVRLLHFGTEPDHITGLLVRSHLQFYNDITVVRSWTELDNRGEKMLPLLPQAHQRSLLNRPPYGRIRFERVIARKSS